MDKINKFITRLDKIGIKVSLAGNAPWVYLVSVNEIRIKERYQGNHGFTAFWYPVRMDGVIKFSDIRKVFSKIREVRDGVEIIPEDNEYINYN